MAAIADDFFAAGDPVPADGDGEAPLFAAVETKRMLCKANCNTDSNISKLVCFSPTGDLTRAPSHIPGSPNYVHRRSSVRGACAPRAWS